MSLALFFWIIYLVGIIFTGYRVRSGIVDSLVFWILIAVLGFAQFGGPIK